MGNISIGTTRVPSTVVNTGDIDLTIPPTTNPIEYVEIVRLNGDLNNEAIPGRDPVKSYDNAVLLPGVALSPGGQFMLSGRYKGYSLEILRESSQDTDVDAGPISYTLGVGNLTDTTLYAVKAESGSYMTQDVLFKAAPGAFIEIIITRDNKSDQVSP